MNKIINENAIEFMKTLGNESIELMVTYVNSSQNTLKQSKI